MNQHQRDTLAFLRGMLRRYRCQGGEIMITCEAAKEYEETIALAEYELGLLDERVAAEVYGFGDIAEDVLVD